MTRERSRARIIEAATELVRERSYAELSVGEVMDRAGIGRTLFYRHFDDLGDLLLSAARDAIEDLYEAQLVLAATRADHDAAAVRRALEVPVRIYHDNGPVLRAVAEAASAGELPAPGQEELRRRFDHLVAEALRGSGSTVADPLETARALNLLNHSYLLDAFGREPRVAVGTAVTALAEIWVAILNH